MKFIEKKDKKEIKINQEKKPDTGSGAQNAFWDRDETLREALAHIEDRNRSLGGSRSMFPDKTGVLGEPQRPELRNELTPFRTELIFNEIPKKPDLLNFLDHLRPIDKIPLSQYLNKMEIRGDKETSTRASVTFDATERKVTARFEGWFKISWTPEGGFVTEVLERVELANSRAIMLFKFNVNRECSENPDSDLAKFAAENPQIKL